MPSSYDVFAETNKFRLPHMFSNTPPRTVIGVASTKIVVTSEANAAFNKSVDNRQSRRAKARK